MPLFHQVLKYIYYIKKTPNYVTFLGYIRKLDIMKTTADLKFRYKDKTYNYSIEHEDTSIRTVEYMWTEGNYSCDCNRGMFLDIDEDMPCGEEIELIEYDIHSEPHPKLGLNYIHWTKEKGRYANGNLEIIAD